MSCFHQMCSLLLSVTLSLRLTHHKPEPVKLWTEMDREEKMWRYYLWSLSHYCHTLPSWSVVTNPVTCSELWCWKPAVSMSGALSLKQITTIFYLIFLNFPKARSAPYSSGHVDCVTAGQRLTAESWRAGLSMMMGVVTIHWHRGKSPEHWDQRHRQSHRHWSSSLSS